MGRLSACSPLPLHSFFEAVPVDSAHGLWSPQGILPEQLCPRAHSVLVHLAASCGEMPPI